MILEKTGYPVEYRILGKAGYPVEYRILEKAGYPVIYRILEKAGYPVEYRYRISEKAGYPAGEGRISGHNIPVYIYLHQALFQPKPDPQTKQNCKIAVFGRNQFCTWP